MMKTFLIIFVVVIRNFKWYIVNWILHVLIFLSRENLHPFGADTFYSIFDMAADKKLFTMFLCWHNFTRWKLMWDFAPITVYIGEWRSDTTINAQKMNPQ